MEKLQTNGETHGSLPPDTGTEGKTPPKDMQKMVGDKLPPNIEQMLLKFRQQVSSNGAVTTVKKEKESHISSKNDPNSTTIRIRIPPHVHKRCKRKNVHDEEEDDFSLFSITPKSRYRSNHFNIRPSTPNSRFLHPRRVFTPDWDKNTEKTKPEKEIIEKENDVSDEDENDNDRFWRSIDKVERHRRLEIYENRIIWGLCNDYQHPAQAIKAAHDGMTYVLSKEEEAKTNRYEEVKCKHTVPKFWEPRVWDKKEDILDEEQSKQLEESIHSASNPRPARPSTPHYHSTKKQSIKRSLSVSTPTKKSRTKKSTNYGQLMLPLGNYETDDEDDLSEWDDLL